MSNARDFASRIPVDGALSNRNAIINGNFDVWQRGTSDVTNDNYFADRWLMNRSSAVATASQESFVLGQTDVPNNPSFYAKMNVTTGNNQARIEQRVEDVTTFAGQTTTLSFYAKGTNPNGGNVEIFLAHRYGTGGSTSVNVVDTIVLTDSWKRFEVTLDIPSVSGKTIGDGNYVQISWRQPDADNSADAWDISLSQVQWEIGDTATPFEHRSYGDELARCQRYFYQWIDGANQSMGVGGYFSSSLFVAQANHPVPMRAKPTASITSGTDYYKIWRNGTSDYCSLSGGTLNASSTVYHSIFDLTGGISGTAGHAGRILGSSSSANIYLDAEL
jgi:FlaG/FlaF family flagellin (archaellin)